MDRSSAPFGSDEHRLGFSSYPVASSPTASVGQQNLIIGHYNGHYTRMVEFFFSGPAHIQSLQDFDPQMPCHIGFCYGRSTRDAVHCIYWPDMFYVSVEEVATAITFGLHLRMPGGDTAELHDAVTRLLRPYRESDRYSRLFESSDLLLAWMKDIGAVRTQRRQRVFKWTCIPWQELLQSVESLLPDNLRREVEVPLVNHLELGTLSVYNDSARTSAVDFAMFLTPSFAPTFNIVDPRLLGYIPAVEPLRQHTGSIEYSPAPLILSQPTRGRPASTVQNAERRYRCSICDCTFVRLEHLTRHTRSHSNERPYICAICNQSFTRVDNLHQHERTMHGIESVITPRRRHRRSNGNHA